MVDKAPKRRYKHLASVKIEEGMSIEITAAYYGWGRMMRYYSKPRYYRKNKAVKFASKGRA